MSTEDLTVRAVAAADADALTTFFGRAGVACHCRYWHFAGTTNEWLARCAHEPERNRDEMRASVELGSADMRGIVAYAGSEIVGWLKLAPAMAVPKLYGQRLYKGLPCFGVDRAGVMVVGCVLVLPEWRRRGVASALVRGAVERARAEGAVSLEALPRRAEGVSDGELAMGPIGVFEAAGFSVVHDFRPYPVLRVSLS